MNHDDALAIKRALEVLQRHSSNAAPTPVIVRDLWEKYEAWGLRERRHWRSTQATHWTHLAPFWGALDVSTITHEHADAYRAARTKQPCAAATRNHELSSMRACFAWAVKRKLIGMNPLSGMEQERMANTRTAFFDEAEFNRLCAAAPHPMARAVFVVAMDTGMRRGELVELKRAAMDLDARLFRLGDGDVKNGSGRIVPLTERAVDALRELPTYSTHVFSHNGHKVGKSTLNDWFRYARDKAGLAKKLTLHSLRHSCATLMRRRGVPWPLIKAALGWKTDVAARRYQQYNADDWASLRDKMNAGISTETRKPPLRAVEKPESDSAFATIEKSQAKNA